jgi:hypothetical protein
LTLLRLALALVTSVRSRFFRARLFNPNVEQRRLRPGMLLQVVHVVNAAFRLVLLALHPALRFVPLFLLARLFLLALRKCRSASWHTQSPNLASFSVDVQQGPASCAAGRISRASPEMLSRRMLSRQKPHRKTFSRKTYQRGSRGWRACPW